MLITDDGLLAGRELIQLALAAELGGITSLQLRLKRSPPRKLAELVRTLVQTVKIPILVNDRPDVGLVAGAAGVHLGPEDLSVDLTRRIAPAGFIIGASVGSEREARAAERSDYWGIGPWRSTSTKADAGPALGTDGFGRLVRQAGGKPCIAIGGVRPEDVSDVLASGGAGVAVASGILGAEDVEAAARRYAEAFRSG